MGYTRSTSADWAATATGYAGRARDDIFKASAAAPAMKASNIVVRECVDSKDNPLSTPIIVGVDVTGSMGRLAEIIVKKGLPIIMNEVYERRPVTDPFLACLAIGDTYFDREPLQVTQFEADVVLAKQIEELHLEGGGGNNNGESYLAAWYFAALKTKCDSMLKRNKKGYLFTIGDEACNPELPKDHIKRVFGDDVQHGYTSIELLEMAKQSYEIFHLIVKPVVHQPVVASWTTLLGDRAIQVQDENLLAEIIVSTIEVAEGKDHKAVAASWSGDTALIVADAIKGVVKGSATSAGGPARL